MAGRRKRALLHRGGSPADGGCGEGRYDVRGRRRAAAVRHGHDAALGRGQKSLRREPRRQTLSVHDAGGRRPFVAVYSGRQLETRDVPVTIGGGTTRSSIMSAVRIDSASARQVANRAGCVDQGIRLATTSLVSARSEFRSAQGAENTRHVPRNGRSMSYRLTSFG